MTRPTLCLLLLLVAGFAGTGSAAPVGGQAQNIQNYVEGPAVTDAALKSFYRARDFVPAWTDEDAAILLTVLRDAGKEGLDPKDYQLAPVQGAVRDVRLTQAALAYAGDTRIGRARLKNLDDDVALPNYSHDAAADLAKALGEHRVAAFLADAPPRASQYAHLKLGLAAYAAIRDSGGWPILPAIAADTTSDGTALLRKRLAYEDSILMADPAADLTEAVKRFQSQHGLEPDGRIGKRTLAELNVSAADRARQIMANMERWRWMPRDLEDNFIAVNIPDASLSLVLNGREVLASRVVVGKPDTPTPILRAEGGGITINPPWNVPDSIARKEILPKLKANPAYLQSQDMILLNGPAGDPYGLHVRWRAIPSGTFPYRIQQHPGGKNALGTIKLELPNRFDVYLHDTPAKGVFAKSTRDVSHGCVRVQRILPLASYALSENLDAMIMISDAVSAGETKYIPLQRRLPVYFLYWTVFPASDGALQFRPDIYGRDKRLLGALERGNLVELSANYPNCIRG